MKLNHLAAGVLAASISSAALAADFTAEGKTLTVYTTTKDTDKRIALTETLSFTPSTQPVEGDVTVFVNPKQRYQKFIGIGGAFTDSAAEVFGKLPKAKQKEVITAYYNPDKGLGYTWGRTTIHSTDFSSYSYTYIKEGDKDLKTFSVKPDQKYRIPLIKKALAESGGQLKIFASPWSPPAFMKTNNNMLQGGSLLPEYYESWANYYTKFIAAYEKQGIPIWGISVQNEPMAKQRWESLILTAEQERDFLKNYLGPIMHKSGYADKPIIVWDHNRDLITQRADTIFSDPEAAKYAWGIGFHWYETWAGGEAMHANVEYVARTYPDKPVLLTEATVEKFSQERYQHWPNGERYGESMIRDFNAGSVAWTDWNIILDERGGPNHVQNFCFAPIHGNLEKGELIYTPTYYYIGHFSKFIRPDAQRVATSPSRSTLLATSFLNANNKMSTVVMNKTEKEIAYHLYVGASWAQVKIPARSIQTLVY